MKTIPEIENRLAHLERQKERTKLDYEYDIAIAQLKWVLREGEGKDGR